MTATIKEQYDELFKNGLAVQKRWGFPDDVGKAVGALALGNFPYSTGQVIMIDGESPYHGFDLAYNRAAYQQSH